MATTARVLHVLILSVWFGASVFVLVLEPGLREAVASLHQLDAVMSTAREYIDYFGLAAGPALLLTLFLGWTPLQVPLRTRALSIVAMTGSALLDLKWLLPKLESIKQAMGRPLEDMPPADTLALEFYNYRTFSTGFFFLNLLLVFLLIIGAVRVGQPKRRFGGIEL